LLFEIPRDEAWDIDEEIDFAIAEHLMLRSMQARAA
jgi:CMP-N-acetylneuraminic acid synthetase